MTEMVAVKFLVLCMVLLVLQRETSEYSIILYDRLSLDSKCSEAYYVWIISVQRQPYSANALVF